MIYQHRGTKFTTAILMVSLVFSFFAFAEAPKIDIERPRQAVYGAMSEARHSSHVEACRDLLREQKEVAIPLIWAEESYHHDDFDYIILGFSYVYASIQTSYAFCTIENGSMFITTKDLVVFR